MKECKIVCDGKECGIITRIKDGFNIKCTDKGKKMCKDLCGKECC